MTQERKTWNEFEKSGLLWWTNRILNLLGWEIVIERGADCAITDVYPVRTDVRGYPESSEIEGFRRLTEYISANGVELKNDTTT